ncbi:protein RESPONSE TO ABA AND SALT 1-like [Argentina anserina]|uniref:protein RESPONSE TO ABA AND SALT 1-like n=1 Tax=Argentina anserina TaxID=57926 RepID=UPI00217622ED|nr:protein RESPONSE TO ABA AND SALT 1-like [Potentilla anserina]
MSSFEAFFEAWLVRQEHYLDELQSAQQRADEVRDVDLRDLVGRVLLHYQQYYEEKSRIAERDVFRVFCPTWFTPLERALLWIAGFKPGLAFRLFTDSVPDLSDDQRVRVARLIEETRVEERTLNDKLAKIHESVAAPRFVNVARRYSRWIDGEGEEEEATRSLKSALRVVVANADLLRTTIATKLVEMLSGAQAVRFLVTVGQFQLKIRNRGLERQQRSGRRW